MAALARVGGRDPEVEAPGALRVSGAQVGSAFGAKKIQLASAGRWPSMPNFIRVTVGTKEEMTKFNTVLDQVLQEGPPKAVAQAG